MLQVNYLKSRSYVLNYIMRILTTTQEYKKNKNTNIFFLFLYHAAVSNLKKISSFPKGRVYWMINVDGAPPHDNPREGGRRGGGLRERGGAWVPRPEVFCRALYGLGFQRGIHPGKHRGMSNCQDAASCLYSEDLI